MSASPDQDQVAQWNANGSTQCPPATSFLVETYQNDTTNTTGGADPDPKFTHRAADDAFFFLIP